MIGYLENVVAAEVVARLRCVWPRYVLRWLVVFWDAIGPLRLRHAGLDCGVNDEDVVRKAEVASRNALRIGCAIATQFAVAYCICVQALRQVNDGSIALSVPSKHVSTQGLWQAASQAKVRK